MSWGLIPVKVFVHRNVANIVHTSDLNILSVLEFALEQLHVQNVIVCDHYGCGGVHRAISGERGALVDHWLQPLSMLYRKHNATLGGIGSEQHRFDRLCEINVEMQVRRLAATPIVEHAWLQDRELHPHGWIYAIGDGLLRDLGPHLSSIAERDELPTIDQSIETQPIKPQSAAMRQAVAAFEGLPDR